MQAAPPPDAAPDPQALLRSRSYVQILVLAALLGLPISAARLLASSRSSTSCRRRLFTDLPETLGFDAAPVWWPLPLLALAACC